jgi:hypothetical protein
LYKSAQREEKERDGSDAENGRVGKQLKTKGRERWIFDEERNVEARVAISLWDGLGMVQVAQWLVICGVLLTTAQMINARGEENLRYGGAAGVRAKGKTGTVEGPWPGDAVLRFAKEKANGTGPSPLVNEHWFGSTNIFTK